MTRRLSDADESYLRRSCAESGVPVVVTDPVIIARAADALRPAATPRKEVQR